MDSILKTAIPLWQISTNLALSMWEKNACLTIANQLMKEPTFDTLRTKEQLGYEVSNYLGYTSGIMSLYMFVRTQATKFSADFVDQHIETFLKSFVNDKLQ